VTNTVTLQLWNITSPRGSMATSAGSVRINALACRRALRRRDRG
jgi:hypothetical protein